MRLSTITAIVIAASTAAGANHARAGDFFSMFDNAFGGNAPSEPTVRSYAPFSPFGERDEPRRTPVRSYAVSGGSYCVRTCDGRYFPLSTTGGLSKAQACENFCPASETKVVYGASIDTAVTENGKTYEDLPNAFRYRSEIVSGCTCNGKDTAGLAQVKIEEDKTLRRGDIVAGPNGLLVTQRDTEGGRSLSFSPASKEIQARYSRLPQVAAQ